MSQSIDLNERQEIEVFNKLCRDHIIHAREKHPDFSKDLNENDKKMIKETLINLRIILSSGTNRIGYVLLEEVYEFFEAVADKDFTRAREEAADTYAVIWRILQGEHLKKDKE